MDDEQKLAAAARMIADPARARMLWSLMGGEIRPAGELALIAAVSNQTASNHLAQLRGSGMLEVEVRGRSHFYRLKDAAVAKALEALMYLANPTRTKARFQGVAARSAPDLLFGRTCYDHLAGSLAVRITGILRSERWIVQRGESFILTKDGERQLGGFGIDVQPGHTRRRFAYPCLDWSERVDHIGGKLGASILDWLLDRKVIVRMSDSRAIRVTIPGTAVLESTFGIRIGKDRSLAVLRRRY